MATPDGLTELPKVVNVSDQPCQQLYESNPVLLGFDVVQYHFIDAYIDGGVAVQGNPAYAYNFEGYQFWFSTQENRDLFISDPWKYAPAWGGFCSWGISRELPPVWPWQADFLGPPASPWEGWAIVDGVLIFNIWSEYTTKFLEEQESNMKKAAQRWTNFFGSLHAGPFNTHCIGHGSLKNWCLSQQPSPWLKPLPDCGSANNRTQSVVSDTDDRNKQGGIVSEASAFHDFNNASLSPYERKWIIAASFLIPTVIWTLIFLVVWIRQKRRKRSQYDSASSTAAIRDNPACSGKKNDGMVQENGDVEASTSEDDS